jgi:hypothetical protein
LTTLLGAFGAKAVGKSQNLSACPCETAAILNMTRPDRFLHQISTKITVKMKTCQVFAPKLRIASETVLEFPAEIKYNSLVVRRHRGERQTGGLDLLVKEF